MLDKQMTMPLSLAEPAIDETAPSCFFHELSDGRLVPVEMGGIVELALFEFSGELVDAIEEHRFPTIVDLN